LQWDRERRRLESVLYGELVYGWIFVDARMALTAVKGACEGGRKFADEAVVWESEVA